MNNWKSFRDNLRQMYSKEYIGNSPFTGFAETEQAIRKQLIEEILSEAPEDRGNADLKGNFLQRDNYFYNLANAQWRELLTKHI